MTIEHLFIPSIARPRMCLHDSFEQQADGSWKATCPPEKKEGCWGCLGIAILTFDPKRIINYEEIRANDENDYMMGVGAIVTTDEYNEKILKKYKESAEKWYYFHDSICDEDRLVVFQIK